MDKDQALAKLGYKPVNLDWAKIEILLGLAACAAGILLGQWATRGVEDPGPFITLALILIVGGGYLTLAGQRSHVYQSLNKMTGYLVAEIQRGQEKRRENNCLKMNDGRSLQISGEHRVRHSESNS